ncbi:hypothetical protein Z043_102871, partial [Scleropages formosus]
VFLGDGPWPEGLENAPQALGVEYLKFPLNSGSGLPAVSSIQEGDEDGGSPAGREGRGLRIFWDRMREPSFSSRWNPFAKDYPFATFTYHPVRNADEKFAALCELDDFREQLVQACQNAHAKEPVPGKANGVIVLNQPLVIEAYVGLMSFIGNQNKLGYCLARGNIGF